MRVESSYPTPTMGISTLSNRNRLEGQATKQINFRSDPVHKLTRRPPVEFVDTIFTGKDPDDLIFHSYLRGGVEYSVIIEKSTNTVYGLRDRQLYTLSSDTTPVGYVNDNTVMQTIGGDTFVLNRDKVVEMDTTQARDERVKVVHINILRALNYSETLSLKLSVSGKGTWTVSYKVPDLGYPDPDYDTADAARATSKVADELSNLIASEDMFFSTSAQGSSLYVKYTDTDDEPVDFTVRASISSGQGESSAVVISDTISSIEGLPLFALPDTLVKVQPNPDSEVGTYYLKAEVKPGGFTGAINPLKEVVWVEHRAHDDDHHLDNTTLPFVVQFDELGAVKAELVDYRPRLKGNSQTVKEPDFVGESINAIGFMQNRLLFITDTTIVMSETDDPANFWKQSAVKDIPTDPIGIRSNAMDTDRLAHAVPHNKDLLVIATNGQFKIDGSIALTPQTAAMVRTTKYDCDVDVPPVSMGNSVFFPISYSNSMGLQEYVGQRDTEQDFASPITHHVKGLMKGKLKSMVASPNLETIAITTTEGGENVIFVYEQYTDGSGAKRQQAWSYWELPEGDNIIDLFFIGNELSMLVENNGSIVTKVCDLGSRIGISGSEDTPVIHLDNLRRYFTEETTELWLDDNYPVENLRVIRGEGYDSKWTEDKSWTLEQVTPTQYKLVFPEFHLVQNGELWLGTPYTSLYSPSKPYQRDEKGIPILTEKVRIARYLLDVENTSEINQRIVYPYADYPDQKFNSRLMGNTNTLLGEATTFTGQVRFSYGQEASLADVEFYTDHHLGCSISGISWSGQHYRPTRRI